MGFYIFYCCFVLATIIQYQHIFGQSNEKYDLLNWYYKQSRLTNQNVEFARLKQLQKRQVDNNYDYNDNSDENDDWYVFDRVEDQINNNRGNGQNNQIRPNNQQQWFNVPSTNQPNAFFTTTTPQPAIPNAGPPRLSPCEENCNTRTTPEYNPVCGTNGLTYFNNGRFECAQFCGTNIGIKNRGRCAPLLPRN